MPSSASSIKLGSLSNRTLLVNYGYEFANASSFPNSLEARL